MSAIGWMHILLINEMYSKVIRFYAVAGSL